MSLNNSTKEQLMSRTGSYSTHGSRRGFSTLGEQMRDKDLHDIDEQKEILKRQLEPLLLKEKSERTKEDKRRMQLLSNGLAVLNKKRKGIHGKYFDPDRKLMNKGSIFQKVAKEFLDEDTYMAIVNRTLEIMEDI